MKKTFALILFLAAAAQARPVPVQCPDGTTRFVSVPAPGATNWVGIVGVAPDGSVVTNDAAVAARRKLREGTGEIRWADGAVSRYRIPGKGHVTPVTHEFGRVGKGFRAVRLVEVLWVDHEGNVASNAIGRAAEVLPEPPSRDRARREGEEKALAAARRRPEPDPEDFVRHAAPADGRRPRKLRSSRLFPKPPTGARAVGARKAGPGDSSSLDEAAALEEYRAKAGGTPSKVLKPEK